MKPFFDKIASLTPSARRIVCEKATEPPHTSVYDASTSLGTYLCRRCGLALFRRCSQFDSGCGWPSFDETVSSMVRSLLDADGQRMEVLCHRCDAHLGHVFDGESFTIKNRRYCINSAAIDFVDAPAVSDSEEAIVAGGCFWGVDYYLRQISGVLKVEVGYTGGVVFNPSYEQVCSGHTGHYEAVRVVYERLTTDYHTILKRFFEIHDPTQTTGQGPDLGQQYHSAIFYYNQAQHDEAESLIQQLKRKGYDVATRLLQAQVFWKAEAYHQDYYEKQHHRPYCHQSVLRFESSNEKG
jgi:peptide methionine sulfoxide reductase msrA/msrB